MFRQIIQCVAAVFLLSLGCHAGEDASGPDSMGIIADYTLAGKYMTHGFNVGGDELSHQPSITVQAKWPDLSFVFWGALTDDRDNRAADELDFLIKYGHLFGGESDWAVHLHAYFDLWIYPHSSRTVDADGNPIAEPRPLQGSKYHAGISLPRRIPSLFDQFLVPSYNVYYWVPITQNQFQEGGVHELLLDTAVPLPLPDVTAVPLQCKLAASMNYNDGFMGVNSGWSHATAHFYTGAPITEQLSWSGSLNYQWSFEDTVNDENEFWASLSVTLSI